MKIFYYKIFVILFLAISCSDNNSNYEQSYLDNHSESSNDISNTQENNIYTTDNEEEFEPNNDGYLYENDKVIDESVSSSVSEENYIPDNYEYLHVDENGDLVDLNNENSYNSVEYNQTQNNTFSNENSPSKICYNCNKKFDFWIWTGKVSEGGNCYGGGWEMIQENKPGWIKCWGCKAYAGTWKQTFGGCAEFIPCSNGCVNGWKPCGCIKVW